jgi:bifunctional N-acetylglucosamine-1-phosphate-uridyltransferase/glucosamine-1-phosphate-acetyltransferase GlmU-like protein
MFALKAAAQLFDAKAGRKGECAQIIPPIDPERTYIDLDVAAGRDVTIYPMVTLEGATRIGEGSIIHSGTRIVNSVIGPEVEILESCGSWGRTTLID